MSVTGSSGVALRAAGAGVSDPFPAGLRVLVVDDDPTCLFILEKMLRSCRYEVTKCNQAEAALSLLRSNKSGYDIVISDVHMPDMDGFRLLEYVGLEMDLPVIMMSADDSKNVVMKGVTHGACDYLIKPVRMEALKNIWQHVVRKRKSEWKELEQSASVEEGENKLHKLNEEGDQSSSVNEEGCKSTKRRKDDEGSEEREDAFTLKKPRVVWSIELHQQFVAAVNQLGIDKAVPKKILEMMNVPGLSRENVASHLQKYRLYLKRLSGVPNYQNNISSNPFMSPQDANYGPLTNLNRLDLQNLAASGQLLVERLATFQAATFGLPVSKSRSPIPVVLDQRNIFSFGNPDPRSSETQGRNKQPNLLHGITTNNMEQNQPWSTSMQVSAQVGQNSPSSSLPILTERISASGNTPQTPTSTRKPILSDAIATRVLARNGLAENSFSPAVSQVFSTLSLPSSNSEELRGSYPTVSALISKGSYPEGGNSNVKGFGACTPNYDILGDLGQNKLNDWEHRSMALNFHTIQQHDLGINMGKCILVNQGFHPAQRNGQDSSNTSFIGGMVNASDHLGNTSFSEDSMKAKPKTILDANLQNALFTEQFGHDELMSVFLKQKRPQEFT